MRRPKATCELADHEREASGGVREESIDGVTPFRTRPASADLDVAHRSGGTLRRLVTHRLFLDVDVLASGGERRDRTGHRHRGRRDEHDYEAGVKRIGDQLWEEGLASECRGESDQRSPAV